jgi:peptide deformylase
VLLNPGDPVESFDGELEKLVQDMFDTRYDAEGVGLAADSFVLSRRAHYVSAFGSWQ